MTKVEELKVLGADCETCHQLYDNLVNAAKNLGIDVEVQYISNLAEIAKYEALSLPCIVINGQKVYGPKIMNAAKVEKFLQKIIEK